jgi:uncharacterized repeat protein (TIGR03803 family)
MPDGSGFAKLIDFDSINGASPLGSLIYESPYLYGMTQRGGDSNGGVIFRYALSTNIPAADNDAGTAIFPNPFNSEAKIEWSSAAENASIRIFNSGGNLVRKTDHVSGKWASITRNDLPAGIYFFVIGQENTIISKGKFIVAD